MRQGFLRYKKACGLVMVAVLLLSGLAGCGSAKNADTAAEAAAESKTAAGVFAWAEEAVATAQVPFAASEKNADAKDGRTGKEAAKSDPSLASSSNAGKTPASSGSSAKTAAASSGNGSSDGSSEGETYGQGTPMPQGNSSGGKQSSAKTCTLSVECGSILNHLGDLTAGKESLVPADGVILPATSVSFSEGDTVFDVLKKAMRQEEILFEFETTPVYSGVYIEGIANLYEFDCGPLSGWMYAVNGAFPNYGCGTCKVKSGDRIQWIYTCDLGRDIGGDDSAGQMGR